MFRDRGASVEAQAAAAAAAAAAAVRRVRAETALDEAQSAAAKIAEENHAVRSVLRVTGAETTVETRGEKMRARTPGRAIEKEKARELSDLFENAEVREAWGLSREQATRLDTWIPAEMRGHLKMPAEADEQEAA